MSIPKASSSSAYSGRLQTQEYKDSSVDMGVINLFSVADLYFSWLDDAQLQLENIRQEVEEACALDNEAELVPESAYSETRFLLNVLHPVLPMPDIMWLEDGGIGFEWRSRNRKGIGTMSIYGDKQIIYGASLGSTRKIKGTCALSDLASLSPFLKMLFILCYQ